MYIYIRICVCVCVCVVYIYLEGVPAVMASEAGLVEDPGISSKLVNQVNRLVAGGTLLCRPRKTGHFASYPKTTSSAKENPLFSQ